MHHTDEDARLAELAREELVLHIMDMERVRVSVEHGVVTLRGTVASEVERQNAVTTVSAIHGVHTVKNDLRIDDEDENTVGEYIDDTLITTAVKGKLLAETGFKSFSVSVETNQGVVTLTGTVDKFEHVSLAELVARTVDGVKTVVNRLQYEP
ncbi:periplasmic protein (fragment) [uncultured delta proteobacterium]|uniref:Periplasmic protein n=1 Tax=uncultured delta proteobacterium TaxID=34034 RepID=A0A212JF89_9DELT